MLSLSQASIPVTLLRFPRIINDAPYLFDKLQPMLNGISLNQFNEAFAAAAQPQLVHCFSDADH